MSDLFVEALPVIDRSALEAFATCPQQARLRLAHPDPVGEAAVIGAAGHDAIAATVRRYVELDGMMSPAELRTELLANLDFARPDIQPAVIERFRGGAWAFASYLNELSPAALIHFDGGEGERSGQLAWEVRGVSVTSEVDLLHLTDSRELLREVDYKSGWKAWGYDDVRDSFQFQVHACLVFEAYPEVQRLEVAVFQTGTGTRTPFVGFQRAKLETYQRRVTQAVDTWLRWKDARLEDVEPWPSAEKCGLCPVARFCPVSSKAARELAADPAAYLTDFAAVKAKHDAMEAALVAHAKAHGPIEANGTRFGIDPKYTPRPGYKLTEAK